jgi:polycomb protein EED
MFLLASFKLIALYALPMGTNNLHVYHSLTHDPIMLFPFADGVRMLNVKHFSPRFSSVRPPFPLDEDEMVESMKKARLNDDDEEEENSPKIVSPSAPPVPVEWEITIHDVKGVTGRSEDVLICSMGVEGDVIVGAGTKGSVWIWKK